MAKAYRNKKKLDGAAPAPGFEDAPSGSSSSAATVKAGTRTKVLPPTNSSSELSSSTVTTKALQRPVGQPVSDAVLLTAQQQVSGGALQPTDAVTQWLEGPGERTAAATSGEGEAKAMARAVAALRAAQKLRSAKNGGTQSTKKTQKDA